jgi:hypothetical protein
MVRTAVLMMLLTLAPGLTTPAPAQEAILVVRHAEQTAPPDVVLTEAGHRRAAGYRGPHSADQGRARAGPRADR